MREQHALTVARVNGRNSTLSDALLRRPKYVAGGWVWVYNTAATVRQGMRRGVDNKVLKEKLSLSTGRAPLKSSLLASPQRLTNQTDTPSGTSSYNLTSHQTCPALPLNPASRCHAANLAPTLTTLTTCPNISRPASPNTSYTLSRPSRLHTTSLLMTSQLPRF